MEDLNHNLHQCFSKSNESVEVLLPQPSEVKALSEDINFTEYENLSQRAENIQIDISNEPTQLDYITAYSTLGAVIISVLLGVIFPFVNNIRKIWAQRIKLKLKFIEYYYDKKKYPIFFIDFKNMYEYPLHIKNVLFFIKFKTHVLPIILRLCTKKALILPQLSEEKINFYIAHDFSLQKTHPLKNEQKILNFINKKHEIRNKISPYDKIKSVYLLIETNIGQIKINVPKWMRDTSSDEILALYLQDVFAMPDKLDLKKHSLKKYMDDVATRYKNGRKERKHELWKWKIEDFFCHIPLDTVYMNFKRMIQRKKSTQPPKSS